MEVLNSMMKGITYHWRSLKFEIFVFYILSATLIRDMKFRKESLSFVIKNYAYYKECFCELEELKKVYIHKGCWIVKVNDFTEGPITGLFKKLAFTLWFCERMKINLEFGVVQSSKGLALCFENRIHVKKHEKLHSKSYVMVSKLISCTKRIGGYLVPVEFYHKAISKLSLKSDIKELTEQWIREQLKGDWVAVHYRGTDSRVERDILKHRSKIAIDSYITYLKEVLDKQCSIFACSDEAQFIDKMHAAFSGKVFALDIQRSDSGLPLHREGRYADKQQREDASAQQKKEALMDLLVLAKAKLIYTTGSSFIDAVQYFNLEAKIVSLDGRKKAGYRYMPIPKKALYDRLSNS